MLPEQGSPCDQQAPWDAWESYLDEYEASTAQSKIACAAGRLQFTPTPADDTYVPAMPTVASSGEVHREKIGIHRRPVNACVARAVSKKDRMKDDDEGKRARDAMRDEWHRLAKKGTWNTKVRQWSQVAQETKDANEEVHFGYLLRLCLRRVPSCRRDTAAAR